MNRRTALQHAALSALLLSSLAAPAQAATRQDVDAYLTNTLQYKFNYDEDGDVQVNFDDGSSIFLAFYDSRNKHIPKPTARTTVDQIRFYMLSPLADKLPLQQAQAAVLKLNKDFTYKAFLTTRNRVTFSCTLPCLSDSSNSQVQRAIRWSINSLIDAEKEFAKIVK